MKKTKTIDLTKMSELLPDEETVSFQPSWDNTILVTAYDRERTLVLTRDGRCLVLPRPLQEVLKQFASDNSIADFERQTVYDMISVYKGRGYIAGNNRLVPTHGTTNEDVVYYMARFLKDKHEVEGRVIASFKGSRHRIFRVIIDTSYKTFVNLLQAANDAAHLQMDILDWMMHSYGVKRVGKRESVRLYDMYQQNRQEYLEMRRRWMMLLVRRVIHDYCTEQECEEIEGLIRHYIEK